MTKIVLAIYRPKSGKEKELEKLIKSHTPILRELELITNRPRLTLKSDDGSYIEVIEWINVEAAEKAHEHPAVAKVWEGMEAISDFRKLSDLSEAGKTFSHFSVVSHLSEEFL